MRIEAVTFGGVVCTFGLLGLMGCGSLPGTPVIPVAGVAMHGFVHGGQQPISNSNIYLYAVGNGGFGTASRSMLNTPGGYVTTGADGSFSFTASNYSCQTGDEVYLLANMGNPGLGNGGNNSFLELTAALGDCSLIANETVAINEVTTVAMVYALAGFATNQTHIAQQNSVQSILGVKQAFATAANLVDVSTGIARTTTVPGNGTVNNFNINGFADAIAPCVNSNGASGTNDPCGQLIAALGNANLNNTADALLQFAREPGPPYAGAMYNLITATPPFLPISNSFGGAGGAILVQYTGSGIKAPDGIAIDANGNIWMSDSTNSNLTELANDGTLLSPVSTGYTSTRLVNPTDIAVTSGGNVVLANGTASGAFFNTFVNGFTPLSGGGIPAASKLTLDTAGNFWFGRGSGLAKFSGSNLQPLSPSTGYPGNWNSITAIAADQSATGHIWLSDNNVTRETDLTGKELSPATGDFACDTSYSPVALLIDSIDDPSTLCNYTGSNNPSTQYLVTLFNSGMNHDEASVVTRGVSHYAIDSAGTNWIIGSVDFALYGVTFSGTSVFGTGALFAPGYHGVVQVDSSGNLWIVGGGYVSEYVGLAAPTATPLYRGAVKP